MCPKTCLLSSNGLQKTYGYHGCKLADLFDIGTQTWSTLPDAPLPGRGLHSQVVLNSTVYVFGGYGDKVGGHNVPGEDSGKGEIKGLPVSVTPVYRLHKPPFCD